MGTNLLIHFDGANNQNTYTTESGQACTFNGTAKLDTNQKKFGVSSLSLTGSNDFVSIPDSSNWQLGNGDFTIECWAYLNESMGVDRCLLSYGHPTNPAPWSLTNGINWQFFIYTDNRLYFQYICPDGSFYNLSSTNPINIASAWHHLAVVKSNGVTTLYVDGVSVGSLSTPLGGAVPTSTYVLKVGSFGGMGSVWKGWIDEVRIVKDKAAWTANFTAPTAQYPTTMSVLNAGLSVDRSSGTVSINSEVDPIFLIAKITSDANFIDSSKWNKVIVLYKHSSGQKKYLVHRKIGSKWIASNQFEQQSNTGTWQKEKIIIEDKIGDKAVLTRTDIGTAEDLTVS